MDSGPRASCRVEGMAQDRDQPAFLGVELLGSMNSMKRRTCTTYEDYLANPERG